MESSRRCNCSSGVAISCGTKHLNQRSFIFDANSGTRAKNKTQPYENAKRFAYENQFTSFNNGATMCARRGACVRVSELRAYVWRWRCSVSKAQIIIIINYIGSGSCWNTDNRLAWASCVLNASTHAHTHEAKYISNARAAVETINTLLLENNTHAHRRTFTYSNEQWLIQHKRYLNLLWKMLSRRSGARVECEMINCAGSCRQSVQIFNSREQIALSSRSLSRLFWYRSVSSGKCFAIGWSVEMLMPSLDSTPCHYKSVLWSKFSFRMR